MSSTERPDQSKLSSTLDPSDISAEPIFRQKTAKIVPVSMQPKV
jgi:hypothetical protein